MSEKIFVDEREQITRPKGVRPSASNDSFKAISLPAPDARTQTCFAAAIALYFKEILCGGGLGESGTNWNATANSNGNINLSE